MITLDEEGNAKIKITNGTRQGFGSTTLFQIITYIRMNPNELTV